MAASRLMGKLRPRLRRAREQFPGWRHYFWDLPLWSAGWTSPARFGRLLAWHGSETPFLEAGLKQLRPELSPSDLAGAVERSLAVKVARESDAYRCCWKSQIDCRIEGLPHLEAAIGSGRPVCLLTGHFGSFYTIGVALAQHGIPVYPVARTVDQSAANPLPRRYFEQLNYRATERRLLGHYLYTDFAGWMDRRLVSTCRGSAVILMLVDLPRRLFPNGRQPVQLLGRPGSLPARLVEFMHKRQARFLTCWSFVHPDNARALTIEPAMASGSVGEVLQGYADRLSAAVRSEPWQWMGLPIVAQYEDAPE